MFDVLGAAFCGQSPRDLLIEAVRYGETPEVKDRLKVVVDDTVGDVPRRVVHDRALVSDIMTAADVGTFAPTTTSARSRAPGNASATDGACW